MHLPHLRLPATLKTAISAIIIIIIYIYIYIYIYINKWSTFIHERDF